MKNYILAILGLLVTLSSCTKDAPTLKEKHYLDRGTLTQTWKITTLKELYGKDTVTWDFTKTPELQSNYVIDMWWGNGRGWDMDDENIGHGIRYTPLVNKDYPETINGPRVLISFEWYLTDDETITRAKIGINTADAIIIDNTHCVLHQLDGIIQRWYYLTAMPNGWGMNGKGVQRPG